MSKKKLYVHDLITEKESSRRLSSDPIEREIVAEDRELAREARRLRLEELIARRNQKLEQIKKTGKATKEIAQAGNEFLKGILEVAKVDPVRAKAFLDSLSQEDIMKINLFSSRGSGGSLQALLPLIKSDKMGVKDIVAIVKMMQPPPEKPTTISEVATLIKVFKEMEKPQQQTDPMKMAMEYIKPFYELMSQKDKTFYDAQITNIQKQIVDPIAYLKQIREIAPSLGFVSADNTGQNIELTKMKLDQERWKMEQNWRMNKELADMKLQQQSEKDKWKLIKDISIPAIKQLQPVLSAAVNAGKQKLNQVGRPSGVPSQVAKNAFLCPECAKNNVQTIIDVSKAPDVAICPECKAEFPKQQG